MAESFIMDHARRPVVLQNRPNVKLVMLDTQVHSNTGGQNSESSPQPGGSDMYQFGAATEGKLTEKKSVAGIVNREHRAQQALLKKVDDGVISVDEFRRCTRERFEEELAALMPEKAKPPTGKSSGRSRAPSPA